MYELIRANKSQLPLLIQYKKQTILENATNIDELEKKKIIEYINRNMLSLLNNYQLIMINNIIIGCVSVIPYEDGMLLEEIYIEQNYRNQGIGSNILEKIIEEYSVIYL